MTPVLLGNIEISDYSGQNQWQKRKDAELRFHGDGSFQERFLLGLYRMIFHFRPLVKKSRRAAKTEPEF
jgi:hypothetical protein